MRNALPPPCFNGLQTGAASPRDVTHFLNRWFVARCQPEAAASAV